MLLLQPKSRTVRSCSRRFVTRRDTRLSRRLELGRYLSSIDWSVVDSITGCENKLLLFEDLIKNGVDILMPIKSVKLHVNDAPCMLSLYIYVMTFSAFKSVRCL